MTTIRAHFDGRVFVPDEPVQLVVAQEVELTVRAMASPSEGSAKHPRGSPAAILEMLRSLAPIPPEWVDELEQAIEEGKTPLKEGGTFDDLRDE